jgi:LuxR family maltose regulon positive regulatory protein
MSTPILATKLYIPPPRPKVVPRPRLIERLNEGLHRKLTLIAAPAGFGKTTLVSTWVSDCDRQVAWLSLDDGDNDPTRFLTYLVAALQKIAPNIGGGVLGLLQSPAVPPPPPESILTTLLNEITAIPDNFVLVLDDYHAIDAKRVDQALTFLLEHLPPQMHVVIATREDPQLPLARLRARDQLTELRVTDLRFTPSEAAAFLNQVMGLDLSVEDVTALEARTEGWIAGLQLAAISLQEHQAPSSFIESFTGSSRFIIDYLAEEVLERQPEEVRAFLLRTSVLERMCAPLCDEVLNRNGEAGDPAPVADSPRLISSQAMLEKLDRSNLFIVPLDNERRWYRYHHLFADLLQQRLHESMHQSIAPSGGDAESRVNELHRRASQWYEDNGLEMEAFHHAAAANDFERAERLIEGKGVPLHFRGAGAPVLNWLESLPTTVLNARPSLWVTYASVLMMTGQPTGVEGKLQAAEATLQGTEPDNKTRDLIGRIASLRATSAVIQHDVETLLAQSRRALEYLNPNNLPLRTAAHWTLGHAYQLQGDRASASRAYTEVISISKSFGPSIYTTAATLCLGQVQESENQFHLAAETYRRAILLAGDPPRPIACNAHLGLAQIYYQWNDLDAAEQHGQQCIQLTRQMDSVDTVAACGVLLARLRLAQGDVSGAVALLEEAEEFVRQHNFMFRMPDVAAAQVLTLLHQGNLAEAAHLAETHELPLSQARVHLAQGDSAMALGLLEPLRHEAEARGWADERLKVMVLQAVAFHAHGEKEKAVQLLSEALALAEPGGLIRIFVDEGMPMAALLQEATKPGFPARVPVVSQGATRAGTTPNYVSRLLAAFGTVGKAEGRTPVTQLLIEPLSERELEVLRLLGTDLNGPEVARELMVSLNTMRTHSKNIYSKLGVNSRREAVRRAEELGLL